MNHLKKLAKHSPLLLAGIIITASLISFGVVYSVSSRASKGKTTSQNSCKDTCVDLYEEKASPDTVTVSLGSYVQFNSKDGKTHDLSLGEGGSEHQHRGTFQSGDFGDDEAWRVQFNDEGTFTFHDHLNPKISILVVVYSKGKEYKVN